MINEGYVGVIARMKRFSGEIVSVYLTLLKVMVPALIAIKMLDSVGGTAWQAWFVSPLMQLLGLSETVGIVWAAAMLSNIYTAMIGFSDLAGQQSLTVAQVTVLGTIILVAHSLPIKPVVAKATGVSRPATLAIRVGGALVLGALQNLVYPATGTLQAERHPEAVPA